MNLSIRGSHFYFFLRFSNPLVCDVCGQNYALLYFPAGVILLTAYKQQVPPLSCPVAACFWLHLCNCRSLSEQPLPLCYQLKKALKGTGDFSNCHCWAGTVKRCAYINNGTWETSHLAVLAQTTTVLL